MEKDNKKDFGKLLEAMSEINLKEDLYDKMPKDKLIDRLIMTEMELEGRDEETDEHSMELWYFVSDETGVKYLTDEKPKEHLISNPGKMDENDVLNMGVSRIWVTDGEINIRVPKKMEVMFPEIKYGDGPIKVILSNITL